MSASTSPRSREPNCHNSKKSMGEAGSGSGLPYPPPPPCTPGYDSTIEAECHGALPDAIPEGENDLTTTVMAFAIMGLLGAIFLCLSITAGLHVASLQRAEAKEKREMEERRRQRGSFKAAALLSGGEAARAHRLSPALAPPTLA